MKRRMISEEKQNEMKAELEKVIVSKSKTATGGKRAVVEERDMAIAGFVNFNYYTLDYCFALFIVQFVYFNAYLNYY